MFRAFCPRHGCAVLLSIDDIKELRRHDDGVAIRFTCQCGYTGWQHDPTKRT